ncbi:hypothetical protein C9Z08_26215, partial [Escherichia coli]
TGLTPDATLQLSDLVALVRHPQGAFNAVSEIAKGRNTRATTGDAQRPNMGMTSIASLNKQNAEFWANRKG